MIIKLISIVLLFCLNWCPLILGNAFKKDTTQYSLQTEFLGGADSIACTSPVTLLYQNKESFLSTALVHQIMCDYCGLNTCEHFNTWRIKKDPSLYGEVFAAENVEKISVTAHDGQPLEALLMHRNSNKLLVVGQGFHSRKEYLVPFLKLFPDYDLLFFDYHGHRLKEVISTYIKKRRDVLTTYLIEPCDDVINLISLARANNKYTAVIGLGMCYSGFTFCAAQVKSIVDGHALFDKLIVDSSVNSILDKSIKFLSDPWMILDHKKGGAPQFVQYCMSTRPVVWTIGFLGYLFLGSPCSELTMADYISKIKQPLLFIRAAEDKLVSYESFRKQFDVADKDTACAITLPVSHALCHIKCKELYAYLIKEFIEAESTQEFVSKMIA